MTPTTLTRQQTAAANRAAGIPSVHARRALVKAARAAGRPVPTFTPRPRHPAGCCQTCGHRPAPARRVVAATALTAAEIGALSDAALRAYRARTAPFADVQFLLACGRGLSPALLADAHALAATVDATGRFTGTTRIAFAAAYQALSARRRVERNAQHWTGYLLAQKAEAWADARYLDALRAAPVVAPALAVAA